MKIYTVDLTHCVALCAEYNSGVENTVGEGILIAGAATYCRVVSLVLSPGEFRYLKNSTSVDDTSVNVTYASASLGL